MYSLHELTDVCRVALARAVYARTKYVLLDDPLSAVVCPFSKISFVFDSILFLGQSHITFLIRSPAAWPTSRKSHCRTSPNGFNCSSLT